MAANASGGPSYGSANHAAFRTGGRGHAVTPAAGQGTGTTPALSLLGLLLLSRQVGVHDVATLVHHGDQLLRHVLSA